MIFEEKTMKTEKIYDGKIINLRIDTVELPDKKYSKREIVEHAGSVAVIAITKDRKVLLVEQYRKPVDEIIKEIPAGRIEIDEEPSETAKRELLEETGYKAKEVEYLLDFHSSPGFTNERIYLFLARDVIKISDDIGVENEKLSLLEIEYEDLLKDIERGRIKDGKTILGMSYINRFVEF